MKKVAVVLAGCGVYDGAEIHESVLTLLALDRRNANVTMFAHTFHTLINRYSMNFDPIFKKN